jgi:gliding motility-associated-like protein
LNDLFSIEFNAEANIEAMSGTIYDRWGSVIYDSQSNPFTWNGTRNNESLNPGVYVYVINVTYRRGVAVKEEVLIGDVTVVK